MIDNTILIVLLIISFFFNGIFLGVLITSYHFGKMIDEIDEAKNEDGEEL